MTACPVLLKNLLSLLACMHDLTSLVIHSVQKHSTQVPVWLFRLQTFPFFFHSALATYLLFDSNLLWSWFSSTAGAHCPPGLGPRPWTYRILFVMFASTRSVTWSLRWITGPGSRLSLRWWHCQAQYQWNGSLSSTVTQRKSSVRFLASSVTVSMGRRTKVSRSWWKTA